MIATEKTLSVSNSIRPIAKYAQAVYSVHKPKQALARSPSIHPDQAQHRALQKARLRQKDPDFKQKYAKSAGTEGTISQDVRGFDLRHSHYLGLAKTRLQHLFVASLYMIRLGAWPMENPRTP